MIMAILGFLAPFIPDVFSMLRQQQDFKHEIAMMRMRHNWRIEEINVQADIAEMKAIRRPHKSFGIQLLDKASEADGVIWRWSMNIVFLAFALIDWMISSVRPAVTYWIFGLYAAIKTANIAAVYKAVERSMGDEGFVDRMVMVLNNESIMTEFDQQLLLLVVSFWFGQRLRTKALKGG